MNSFESKEQLIVLSFTAVAHYQGILKWSSIYESWCRGEPLPLWVPVLNPSLLLKVTYRGIHKYQPSGSCWSSSAAPRGPPHRELTVEARRTPKAPTAQLLLSATTGPLMNSMEPRSTRSLVSSNMIDSKYSGSPGPDNLSKTLTDSSPESAIDLA